ncbi:MAG: TetR/AcrR family transcriptional regulator [Desulfobacterales bacterium]|nr:MAG: TetR/AcrR family transcriptional regulator [Desulfobacterales bacterium]
MSRKEAILEAAIQLFARKGYKETSMQELAEMIGAAGGTVFYHFKNKEELFVSMLENVKEGMTAEFRAYFAENNSQNGLEMLEGALQAYLHLAGQMEERFLLLHRHYPYALAEVNPVCRGHLEAIYDCFIATFERAIVRGKTDGSIGDVSPPKTALIIFLLVDGLVRFKTYNLYDAGALTRELMAACRRIVQNRQP